MNVLVAMLELRPFQATSEQTVQMVSSVSLSAKQVTHQNRWLQRHPRHDRRQCQRPVRQARKYQTWNVKNRVHVVGNMEWRRNSAISTIRDGRALVIGCLESAIDFGKGGQMNSRFRLGLALSVTVLSGGCMFGELGIYGQEREDYLKSIKHYIAYWDKPGMTMTERQRDWVQCGGTSDGSFSPYAEQIKNRMDQGFNRETAWDNLREEFKECLYKKGYTYK